MACAGIHNSDIPSFLHDILWGERSIVSVANFTTRDVLAFLQLALRAQIKTRVTRYRRECANEALADLRGRGLRSAAVLIP